MSCSSLPLEHKTRGITRRHLSYSWNRQNLVAWITYRTIGDLVKAKHWFEKSLDAGDVEASLYLVKIYMVGELGAGSEKIS